MVKNSAESCARRNERNSRIAGSPKVRLLLADCWPSGESTALARIFVHTCLMALKLFNAVVISQDLSFDSKFGRLKSHDTVPFNVVLTLIVPTLLKYN